MVVLTRLTKLRKLRIAEGLSSRRAGMSLSLRSENQYAAASLATEFWNAKLQSTVMVGMEFLFVAKARRPMRHSALSKVALR